MPKIKDLIAAAASDSRITGAEWTFALKPAVDALPKAASEEAQPLLDLWANDQFTFDPMVREAAAYALAERGYPTLMWSSFLGSSRLAPPAVPASVPAVRAENVGEVDTDFEAVSAAAGRTEGMATVAVLDTGVDTQHPELAEKLWTNPREIPDNGVDDDGNRFPDDVHGWDFFYSKGALYPGAHGTHVTGIATRGTHRVRAIAVNAFPDWCWDLSRLPAAIDYAAANGAKAVNMSFRAIQPYEVGPIRDAIARHPDVLFVIAAANEGQKLGEGPYAPNTFLASNDLPNLIVVAAANVTGERAGFSNYGAPFVDVAAHGGGVYSLAPGGGYTFMDGTSMATPNVTAIAGKCLAIDPTLSPPLLKRLLMETCDARSDWAGIVESGGLVNEARAIRLAALRWLVKGGSSAEAAADRLSLSGPERQRLLALLPAYLG